MRKTSKKRSMILMAGVLAASIVVGNARWMATAQEVVQSTEAEVKAEQTTTLTEVVNESAESDQTESDQTGTTEEQPGGGNEVTEEPAADNSGENTEENSSGEQQEGTGSEQQDNNTGETANAVNEAEATGQDQQTSVVGKTDEDASVESSYPAVESNSEWTGDNIVPSWAISDQQYISGNLGVAEQLKLLEREMSDRVNRALSTYHLTEEAVTYEDSNFLDIFAVYAVKHGMTDNFPYGVEFENQEAREELVTIFNKMTRVNKAEDGKLLVVRLAYEDVMDEYGFDDAQKAAAASLVNDEARALLQEMYDTSILSKLSDEEFSAIETSLSSEVGGARRAVLLAALSLEGKVNYFWGGKSYHVGWDERWGQLGQVTAEGSTSTGAVQSYGLDCSGFVSWAFINGGGDQSVIAYIGNGTANQFSNSYDVSWDEAQPGDLVFYKTPNSGGINHVGIVVSTDNGEIKVVHCSSGNNNVVVTGKAGFQYVRRPYIYSE